MDFLKRLGFWVEIVFILFTLLMMVISGFSYKYILILLAEVSLLLLDWFEKKKRK